MRPPNLDHNQFDLRRIESLPLAAALEYREVIASTQDLAKDLAVRPDLNTPLLVLAQEQQAGRGRGQNTWWSPRGAVSFSLIIEPKDFGIPPQFSPRVSLAAALAVCEAVGPLAPGLTCGIKWPNDVYLAGRKICGVLVEMPGRSAPAAPRMILGVGLNVNNSFSGAPAQAAAEGASLMDITGRTHELTGVLTAVLSALHTQFSALGRHDPAQAGRWQARSLLAEREIIVQQGSRRTSGRCQGIGEDGTLMLASDDGLQCITSGHVCQVTPPLELKTDSVTS